MIFTENRFPLFRIMLFSWGMIFSENRPPLFRITLQRKTPERFALRCFLFPAAGWTRPARDGFWRLDLVETQKAPSRIAPTNTNAAHTARTLSFIVRSTRRTSIRVVLKQSLAECSNLQKRIHCCIAAGFCCTTQMIENGLPTS